MAFPILALVGLGAVVLLIAKGGGGKAAPTAAQRPKILPGKSGCYDVPAYGGSGRDISDIPPAQRLAFEDALARSTDSVGLDGLATTLDCIGYSVAAKRFRLRAAQLRADAARGGGGFPGGGRTTPPVVGPTAYVPGCVPPAGWAAPAGWNLGMALAADPTHWPGMPEGYTLGSPLSNAASCPVGWVDSRGGAADAGVDGLPEPLKSAVKKALAESKDSGEMFKLSKHLDEMGQKIAGDAVRAKAISILTGVSLEAAPARPAFCPTGSTVEIEKQIDGIAARIMLGELSVADAIKMDADYTAACILPFSWAKVRHAIAVKTPGFKSVSELPSSEPGEVPLGSLGPKGEPISTDPFAVLPGDIKSAVQLAYDSGDPQQLDDVANDLLVENPTYHPAWLKVKADARAIRLRWTTPLTSFPDGVPGSLNSLMAVEISEAASAPWFLSPVWRAAAGKKTEFLWNLGAASDPAVPGSGKAVADEFWKRGYKTAANEVGKSFYPEVHPGNIDAWYPLP